MIRGLFLGLICGVLVSVLIQKFRIKFPVIISGLFLVVILSAFLISSPEIEDQFLSIPIVERYWSLIDPSVTTRLGQETMKGRIEAIEKINRIVNKSPWFGFGYGENKKYKPWEFPDPVLEMISHSGPSWMIYRTGYIGSIALILCLLWFVIRGLKMFMKSQDGGLARVAYGGACASLVGVYATTLGANMMFGADRFTVHIAIVIGIVFSNINESMKSKVCYSIEDRDHPIK
jgi:cell division protein FtsW (lipid II flippase)